MISDLRDGTRRVLDALGDNDKDVEGLPTKLGDGERDFHKKVKDKKSNKEKE